MRRLPFIGIALVAICRLGMETYAATSQEVPVIPEPPASPQLVPRPCVLWGSHTAVQFTTVDGRPVAITMERRVCLKHQGEN